MSFSVKVFTFILRAGRQMPFRITTKNVLQFTWRRRTVDSAKEKLKDLKGKFSTSQVVGRYSHTNSPLLTMKYSRKFLRSLRSSACTPCPQVLGELNSLGVLRYRGGKGGKKTRGNYLNIFSRTTQRDYANFGYLQAPLTIFQFPIIHSVCSPNFG